MKTKLIFKILLISLFCISFTTVQAQRPKQSKAQHAKYKRKHKHAPNYRYAKLPRWGYTYKTAPKNAFVITHSGKKYHFHSGIYYKHVGANYVIVKAPIGIRVRTLPKERFKFVLNGRKYFYYYGTFYVKSDDDTEYVTIDPPKGARIDALPEGYNTVELNGEEYYEFEGTYYKEVTDESGEELYEVVGEK